LLKRARKPKEAKPTNKDGVRLEEILVTRDGFHLLSL
jgi:hypothetical protein